MGLIGGRIIERHPAHLSEVGFINQQQVQADQHEKAEKSDERANHVDVRAGNF
jgi:hypothetical protein